MKRNIPMKPWQVLWLVIWFVPVATFAQTAAESDAGAEAEGLGEEAWPEEDGVEQDRAEQDGAEEAWAEDAFSEEVWEEDDWGEDAAEFPWSGFIEGAFGTRIDRDPLVDSRNTLEEMRLRIERDWQPGKLTLSLKADAGYDGIEDDWFAEVRDLTVSFSTASGTDFRIGRQIQTWGTGDLVFLNDLFPKDFVSFFAGRDDEYLKAPGNSFRLSHYAPLVNFDFVWTPVFESDVYLTGERFSFFSPSAGANVAPDPPLSAIDPDRDISNGEFSLRLHRTIEGREFALYGYSGFFKQPNALTPDLEPTFASLSAYGASLRQPAGPGLFNAEVAWYDSRDDRDGTDPLLPNSQFRALAGYEWEVRSRFTVGFQYYLEWTLDHDELSAHSPSPQFEPDEYRHLLTNRLTYRSPRDRFTWSLFTFYSPSDEDAYFRPVVTYRYSDQWSFVTGGNLFMGDQPQTFFSQLQDASNLYLRLRYNY